MAEGGEHRLLVARGLRPEDLDLVLEPFGQAGTTNMIRITRVLDPADTGH